MRPSPAKDSVETSCADHTDHTETDQVDRQNPAGLVRLTSIQHAVLYMGGDGLLRACVEWAEANLSYP